MKTTKELAEALLKMAGEAVAGDVNYSRADVLCKCTDALIRLTRLQMDLQFQVANGQHYQLPWAESDKVIPVSPKPKTDVAPSVRAFVEAKNESARLQQLRNHLAEYDAKLDGELSDTERAALQSKRKFTADRIAHFEKLEARGG